MHLVPLKSTTPAVYSLFRTHHEPLLRFGCSRFPRTCQALVEDVVSEVFEELLLHPELLGSEDADARPEALYRLMRTICWRKLRALHRRGQHHPTSGLDEEAEALHGRAPGQEWAAEAHINLPRLLGQACRQHGGSQATAVQRALEEGMLHGESEGVLAQRYGVRREYLNRTRRELREQLWD